MHLVVCRPACVGPATTANNRRDTTHTRAGVGLWLADQVAAGALPEVVLLRDARAIRPPAQARRRQKLGADLEQRRRNETGERALGHEALALTPTPSRRVADPSRPEPTRADLEVVDVVFFVVLVVGGGGRSSAVGGKPSPRDGPILARACVDRSSGAARRRATQTRNKPTRQHCSPPTTAANLRLQRVHALRSSAAVSRIDAAVAGRRTSFASVVYSSRRYQRRASLRSSRHCDHTTTPPPPPHAAAHVSMR